MFINQIQNYLVPASIILEELYIYPRCGEDSDIYRYILEL